MLFRSADDTPTLSASVTSATLTDTAANDAFAGVTGTLSTADRDTGDTATYSITGGASDTSHADFDVSKTSAYGTLYLNSSSGAYSFEIGRAACRERVEIAAAGGVVNPG